MIVLQEPYYTGETFLALGKEWKEVEHGWGMKFDEFNVILYKLSLTENGEYKISPEGYYSDIAGCLRGMVNKQVLLQGEHVKSLEELISLQNKWLMEIVKYVGKK